jgi:hypothetical protein
MTSSQTPQGNVPQTPPQHQRLLFAVTYAALGASIGTLAGLSSASVTLPIMAALLSLASVGTMQLVFRTPHADRQLLLVGVLCFCLSFLPCLLLGVAGKVNHWLIGSSAAASAVDPVLLKVASGSRADAIESACRRGEFQTVHDLLNPQSH